VSDLAAIRDVIPRTAARAEPLLMAVTGRRTPVIAFPQCDRCIDYVLISLTLNSDAATCWCEDDPVCSEK